jgi:hypothetical protein
VLGWFCSYQNLIRPIQGEAMDKKWGSLDKVNVYPIRKDKDGSLMREDTRIANLSVALGDEDDDGE